MLKVLRHQNVRKLSYIRKRHIGTAEINPSKDFTVGLGRITYNILDSAKDSNYFTQKKLCSTNPSACRLADSLTPEQELRLTQISVQDCDVKSANLDKKTVISTRKSFKVKSIIEEIDYLDNAGFPLPKILEDSHWNDLLTIENRDIRVFYLDALGEGKLTDEKKLQLYKDDQIQNGPIVFPQKTVDEIMAEGDSQKIQRLEEIRCTYESMWQSGQSVYPFIDESTIIGLLEKKGNKSIAKAINYISDTRNFSMSDYIKKRARQAKFPIHKKNYEENIKKNNHIIYGLGHNTIYHRVYKKQDHRVDTNKTIREFNEWGQPLVIDLSFVKNMTYQQTKSLFYRELAYAFKYNVLSPEPFAIYLTNYDPECKKCLILNKAIANIMDDDYPVVVTEKSYLELFPQKRLLYLSPDSTKDLMKYDPDDVYIIGGVVDTTGGATGRSVPYTLSTAKKENIRHARLPMKRTIGIIKELNVDHCVSILADFKFTKDWLYSFRWVPPRCYRNRLKSVTGFTPQMEAVYMAHRELCPSSASNKSVSEEGEDEDQEELNLHRLHTMPPNEYRQRYKTIVENWVANAKPNANGRLYNNRYTWNKKEEWNEKKFGQFK
jgi:ribonuclease P protein 1